MELLTAKEMTMTKLFKQVGDEVIEFTEAEYAQVEIDKIEAKRVADEVAAIQARKDALLAKLGITADEAALLLG
jgi:hypothetical protein